MDADAQENSTFLAAQERETCEADYPCPDEVWIGPYRDIADLIGIRDWRVWLGITAALSARAHRNIHVAYHGPLWGHGFYLLVAKSSSGKSLCTDLCRALLPRDYETFTSVESGQALAESIATMVLDDKGKLVRSIAFPALLSMREWTLLIQNMEFHGSSLLERFCEIYDGVQVDLNRADKKRQGKIRIASPTLTLCGTTTEKRYTKMVTEKHLVSGFINRHFIMPGLPPTWGYRAATEAINYDAVAAYAADHLPLGHTFGLGQPMSHLYTQEAFELDDSFGMGLFNPIHNDHVADNDALTRLHVYTRRIACLYAWVMRSPYITTQHAHATHLAVRTSLKFLLTLHDATPADLPPYQRAQATLEDKILAKVGDTPGITPRVLCNLLKRHGGYTAVSKTIENLIHAGALRVDLDGPRKTQKRLFPTS